LRLSSAALAAAIVCLGANAAQAAPTVETLKQDLDFAWMMVAAALVLLMQAGFLLLEAGMVRSKNSINVAQKNLLDMAFSTLVFATLGFMIAFGSSGWLPFGTSGAFFLLGTMSPWETGFFVFQIMFCATAATIVSGAVAERMRLSAYLAASIVLAGLIYPIFAHWAWGGALQPNTTAFLANMGFVDFAGSTVVHATGAWVALAACLVLGARIGRFDADGRPIRIAGHSPVLTAAGALLLFVGWIGFNGGSTTTATPAIAGIIANTVIAGAAGAAAGYFAGWHADGVIFPEKAVSGLLGGLVAITAGCHIVEPGGALLLGLAGGAVAVYGNVMLERRLGIDDAVGAIGVHGLAGVLGTLGLALLAPVDRLPAADRLIQLGIQATGSAVNFVWAFGTGLLFFLVIGKLLPLRVTAEQEGVGLNEAEHGTRLGVGHVERALSTLVAGQADLAMRLAPVPGDESETLTELFNSLMDNIEEEEEDRRRRATELRDQEEAERMSALANATFEAIWILRDGVIIDGNRKLEELFGQPLMTLVGRHVTDLVSPMHRRLVSDALTQDFSEPYEIEIALSDGRRIPVEIRGRRVDYKGGDARIGCLVDLRPRRDAEERIRHLALHDTLTGLPNRALFSERLDRMNRLANDEVLGAVLLIDLDRFKDINDVHGHPGGDAVIRTAATRLLSLAGPGDTVARLGGDEFAFVMPQIAFAAQATDMAFRIVTQLGLPIDIGDGVMVRTGASVGIAIAPRDGQSTDRLVSRADTALYHAKNGGRNMYCMFEPGMEALDEQRRTIEADLDGAALRGEFELHFQPRVNVRDCTIGSYEALIRWHHPQRGLVGPADFIAVAEQSGKIVQIGEWVLRTACLIARREFGDAAVSVNVSPVQFRQKDFVEMVADALKASGLAPGRLELEITEGVLIDDDRRATRILRELKKLGVTIALDDFGTGYSSLGYLSRFPFDTIKVDRSFVRELTRSDNVRAIVTSIIGLGNGLRMNVVAEGVEDRLEACLLAEIGCNELQGFLLGRPEPVDSLCRDGAATMAERMFGSTDTMVRELRSRLGDGDTPSARRASA
jgi:ammonium transporter, Amt family